MTSPLTKFTVAGGLVALGFALSPAGAHAQDADPAPDESVPCMVTATSVQGGTATITVGPDGCDVPVGPISFSAYDLPTGERWPYDMQELIAHHPANGSMYAAGFHSLTLDFGDPCNWQTDLYRGDSETIPSFGDRLYNSDWVENQVCVDETPTTIASETGGPTATTAPGGGGGETTTTVGAAVAGPTTTETGATTTTDVASAGPTSGVVGGSGATARSNPAGGPALPATGPAETLTIGLLGGTLVGLGAFARRMARS